MIRYLFNSGDITIFFFCLVYILYFILIILKFKKNKKLFFIPLIMSIIHMLVYVSGSAFFNILPFYLTIYIISILIVIYPFVKFKIIIYFLCSICLILSIYPNKIVNYTRKSKLDAYISLCDYLEENYILSEHKKINYKKLKDEGIKLIKENKYYEALDKLVEKHYDGHMGLAFYNTDNNYIIDKIKKFNDYGLSLITLDDGNTIAINVEDNLEIKNGDIVVKWNGVPINEAIEKVDLPISEGLLDNEKIQKTFYLSGNGKDSVEVTYIDSNNNEKTIKLNKIEKNLTRALTSFGLLNHTRNEEDMHKMLNKNIGYLRVTAEETNFISDTIAYLTGDHITAREKFRKKLRELKNQGMTKLVIDIRNNSGGYEEVATALTSLFTKEKMYAFSLGVKKGTELKKVEDRYIKADGEFSNLEILVLTSMRCGSAGDGLSLYLSRLDNVTVAGITNPSGINQETGGYIYMPDNAYISFPVGLILDNDGKPNIDVDNTRISRNPVDIKIPLSKEAALKIFNGEDYELEWAINFLEKK